jgi:hypothetical protein
LDEVKIPYSTAYWWIDRYKEYVGIRTAQRRSAMAEKGNPDPKQVHDRASLFHYFKMRFSATPPTEQPGDFKIPVSKNKQQSIVDCTFLNFPGAGNVSVACNRDSQTPEGEPHPGFAVDMPRKQGGAQIVWFGFSPMDLEKAVVVINSYMNGEACQQPPK